MIQVIPISYRGLVLGNLVVAPKKQGLVPVSGYLVVVFVSDSGKENVAMVSPETPQRRALTFEQPVQSDSSIHDIKMLRIPARLLARRFNRER
jgi:hypothetical protein